MGRLKQAFDFRGRVSRLGYWRGFLLTSVLGAGVWVLTLFTIMAGGPGWVPALLAAPILVLMLGYAIRRLHDRGKSGWWLALFYGFPIAANVAFEAANEGGHFQLVAILAVLAGFVVSLWSLIEIGFLRGKPAPNRFGPATT